MAFGSSALIWNLQWGRRNSFLVLDLGQSGTSVMGIPRNDSSIENASEQVRSEAARVLSFIGECGEDLGREPNLGWGLIEARRLCT